MILQILLLLVGAFIFLFVFWKRLKEDYFENQIFSTGFYIFLFVILANALSRVLTSYYADTSGYWFWLSTLGVLLGIGIGKWRFNLRFFELLEASVLASFAPIILFLFYNGLTLKRSEPFFVVSVIALFIGLYYFLNTRYKTFAWYKSGRVGFSGLTVLGIFFLMRGIVAYRFPDMVSFSRGDWLISGIAAFLSFLTLANLTLRKQ